MAVNKIVHYCWFGNSPLPNKEKMCIESWKNAFPGYEIKLWNEENFDYKRCNFAKQAYEVKKYAFVSDYARAKILYEYGGVYLDTDVQILYPFYRYFEMYDGVVAFERRAFIGTAVIACQKEDLCMKQLLDYYEKHDFIQKDGTYDNIANVSILTDIMKEKGLILGGKRQSLLGYEVFNREVFYPKKVSETEFNITEETVAIHMCSNSWLSDREKKRGNSRLWIEIIRPVLRISRSIGIRLIGKERIRTLEIKLRNRMK